jgi:hypothetical protein
MERRDELFAEPSKFSGGACPLDEPLNDSGPLAIEQVSRLKYLAARAIESPPTSRPAQGR